MEIKIFNIKYLAVAGLFITLFYACKKESVGGGNVNLPVVEAYLMAGKAMTVNIYGQKALTDTAKFGPGIQGLTVNVSDGSKTVKLTNSGSGVYTYADSTFLVAGKTYTLSFTYLSYAISASTVMPAKPANFATQHASISVDDLTGGNNALDTLDYLTWTNPDSLNHVLVFNNQNSTVFPVSGFGFGRSSNFELNTERKANYAVTQRPFAYFGHYQVILYRVNQEYINLLTSNASSATSSTLANQPTNVNNGLGIFTAMQADTLTLLVQ